jgi:PadR family transcriptional regulator, regulatory protein PadR
VDDERELLRGNTPTLVLAVLENGPQHGYAIAREINRRSGQSLQCKQGTLYPALYALERDGLVQGEWEQAAGQRPRKVYAITEAGRKELARRITAWKRFSLGIESVIEGVPREQPA